MIDYLTVTRRPFLYSQSVAEGCGSARPAGKSALRRSSSIHFSGLKLELMGPEKRATSFMAPIRDFFRDLFCYRKKLSAKKQLSPQVYEPRHSSRRQRPDTSQRIKNYAFPPDKLQPRLNEPHNPPPSARDGHIDERHQPNLVAIDIYPADQFKLAPPNAGKSVKPDLIYWDKFDLTPHLRHMLDS